MAQSRHAQCADECPLSGVKRHDAIAPLCRLLTQSGHSVASEHYADRIGQKDAPRNPEETLELTGRNPAPRGELQGNLSGTKILKRSAALAFGIHPTTMAL